MLSLLSLNSSYLGRPIDSFDLGFLFYAVEDEDYCNAFSESVEFICNIKSDFLDLKNLLAWLFSSAVLTR